MIDIGFDHLMVFICWKPERNLNPQFAHVPDVEKHGLNIYHKNPVTGKECISCVIFDSPEAQELYRLTCIYRERERLLPIPYNAYTVECWEPLTLSPSLLCKLCGDHGFIKQGNWQKA